MHKKILAAAIAATMASSAMALEVFNDDVNSLSIGGRIGVASDDSSKSLNDDSSRINFKYTHDLGNGWTANGVAEWSFKSQAKSGEDVFGNRLGNIGLSHEEFGAIAVGKQFSVFGEIAEWASDRMLFNGAQWTGIYDGMNGDGGISGTGRADDAITYRNSFGDLNIGVQYQAKGTGESKLDDNNVDYDRNAGYQFAASYDLPMGFSVGYAYNETKFDKTYRDADKTIVDHNGESARANVFSAKFEMDALYVAATYGEFRNQLQMLQGNEIAAKAKTTDLYASYSLDSMVNGVSVYTGYQKVDFDKDSAGENTKEKANRTSVGAMYEAGPMLFGAQYDWNDQKNVLDGNDKKVKADDVFTVTARYYF